MHFMYAVAILPQLYKDEEVESVVKDGKFCLQKQEDHYQLKRDHAYYLPGTHACAYTNKDIHVE